MRDVFLIGIAGLIALLVGGLLYMFGPGSAPGGVGGGPQVAADGSIIVPFTVLRQGDNGPQNVGRVNYRIKTQEQLETLWGMLYGANAEKTPYVDFSTNEVLAVFDGSHATGGYSVSVAQVTDADARTVSITRASPGSACIVTQAFTAPFELIVLPKSTLPLTHQDEASVNECR
jgi:hypothetical protein